MRREDFDIFFDTVVNPCIMAIKEDAKTKGFENLECFKKNDNDDKSNKRIKKSIYRNYQNMRDYLKYNYMSKKTEVALDRHKIASCMVYAILKSNPIKVNMWIPQMPLEIVLANEYLAFYVALNIIEMYELDRIESEGRNDDNEKFSNIIVPKTYYESDNPENTYESNLCKAWYYIKIDNIKKYDALGYANVFFLLQKYSEVYKKWNEASEKLKKYEENNY